MFKQILFLIATAMLVIGCGCDGDKKEKDTAEVEQDVTEATEDTTEADVPEADSAEADETSADTTEPVDVAGDVTPQD